MVTTSHQVRHLLIPSVSSIYFCNVCYNIVFNFSRSLSGDEEGVLCDTISRKTLFYLIATLNAAFPDYDFSMAKVGSL